MKLKSLNTSIKYKQNKVNGTGGNNMIARGWDMASTTMRNMVRTRKDRRRTNYIMKIIKQRKAQKLNEFSESIFFIINALTSEDSEESEAAKP